MLDSYINTRFVFRVYAAVVAVLGIVALNGPATALGADLQPAFLVLHPTAASPWGQYVVPRIVGALLITAALIALAFARLDDGEARRRSLNRFAAAHIVFGVLFSGIAGALLTPNLPEVIVWAPLVAGIVLSSFAVVNAQARSGIQNGLDGLRSQYDAQIRQAARREERARLARDLHDAVKQQLFAIQTAAATVETRLDTDQTGARTAAGIVRSSAHEALVEMQTLIDQLQTVPMENTGLVEALRRQCEALGFRTGAHVDLTIGGLPSSHEMVPGAHEALYRFAQEALANVGRHARAKHVAVRLGVEADALELSITDDGAGFDHAQSSSGMGRRNMADRAHEIGGRCAITSTPGSGTVVRCVVPLTSGSGSKPLVGALTWVAISGTAGFLLYWAGGANDMGTPAYYLGLEFLRVFGIALGIGVVLMAIGQALRVAARFDQQLLRYFHGHADLDRHR